MQRNGGIGVGAPVGVADQLKQFAVAAGAVDAHVEFIVEDLVSGDVLAPDGALHTAHQTPELLQRFPGDQRGRQTAGAGLQSDGHLNQLIELVVVAFMYPGATVGCGLDQTFLFQLQQGLPDRHGADLIALADGVDHQFFPLTQGSVHNLPLEPLVSIGGFCDKLHLLHKATSG